MTSEVPFFIRLLFSVLALMNVATIASCNKASSAEKKSLSGKETEPPAGESRGNGVILRELSYPMIQGDADDRSLQDDSSLEDGELAAACPVCGKKKGLTEDLCSACHDEIANTCYRCGEYSYGVNGKLCDDCGKKVCALCNRKKDTQDDLCTVCHNKIEERGHINTTSRKR